MPEAGADIARVIPQHACKITNLESAKLRRTFDFTNAGQKVRLDQAQFRTVHPNLKVLFCALSSLLLVKF